MGSGAGFFRNDFFCEYTVSKRSGALLLGLLHATHILRLEKLCALHDAQAQSPLRTFDAGMVGLAEPTRLVAVSELDAVDVVYLSLSVAKSFLNEISLLPIRCINVGRKFAFSSLLGLCLA